MSTHFWENVHPFLAKFMMKSHFCSILHKKTHKRLNEKDFELDFFSIFLPTVYFLNLNSAICFGSVFSNLTEPKRTEPKLPKHRNFGIFGSVRSSTAYFLKPNAFLVGIPLEAAEPQNTT